MSRRKQAPLRLTEDGENVLAVISIFVFLACAWAILTMIGM